MAKIDDVEAKKRALPHRDDGGIAQLAARSLDHLTTRRAVTEERELLAVLDALADGVQHGPLPEPDLATAAAPIERA